MKNTMKIKTLKNQRFLVPQKPLVFDAFKHLNSIKFKKKSLNKKGAIEEMVKTILWIVFFVILSFGVYYLIKYITE